MTLKEFLEGHADPRLMAAIAKSIENASANETRTYLAHVVDVLLEDESVESRLDDGCRLKAKASLADQIRGFTEARPKSGELAFDLEKLADPAIAFTKDLSGAKVTPLGLLAGCLNPGILEEPHSIRTQEVLHEAGVRLDGLGVRPQNRVLNRRDFTYQALKFGTDLTAMARSGLWSECPVIGMTEVLEQLAMLVSAADRSVVLVGEPGVGKTAIVEGLAFHLARGTRPLIPPSLREWTLVSISPMDLKADTGVQGALEARIKAMLDHFESHRNVIPFFDEVHTLLNTEDASTQVLSTAIKPAMARGAFRCIGATTDREYARFITSDEAMKQRFAQVTLPEPSEEETLQILQGIEGKLLGEQGQRFGVKITPEAYRAVISVTTRYQRSDKRPRKSINLLREVVMERVYRLQNEQETRLDILEGDVGAWFSKKTGIPADMLDDSRADFYDSMKLRLSEDVRGQGPAIESVCSWLKLHASGWLDPRRPRGRFLFLGPPGVGKSELATRLAAELIRDPAAMVVRTMSDFGGQSARSRWQGADPGFVGFGTTSTVYSEVLVRPFSVVVLDEFEKADPSLGELLISMLDGIGQDSQGRRVDFSQCIFVLTSNGLEETLSGTETEDEVRAGLLDLGGIWQQALVDRLDRVVLFNDLDRKTLREILEIMIRRRNRVASKPLPSQLEEAETRELLLDAALDGHRPSARRLERALAQWLINAASRSQGT